MRYLTLEELEANLGLISQSPVDSGQLDLIVRRPGVDEREVLSEGLLDLHLGLVGDTWSSRSSSNTSGGPLNTDRQLTLMNSRVIELLAQTKERWPLAGDQLFIDLDLSATALPPGTRLKIGMAVVEITAKPHTGCAKFAERFGRDELLFVNAPTLQELRLRGVNARVIEPGLIRTGDPVNVIREAGG
jgi:MOSC domain-containing protein YiiM